MWERKCPRVPHVTFEQYSDVKYHGSRLTKVLELASTSKQILDHLTMGTIFNDKINACKSGESTDSVLTLDPKAFPTISSCRKCPKRLWNSTPDFTVIESIESRLCGRRLVKKGEEADLMEYSQNTLARDPLLRWSPWVILLVECV